MKKFSKAHRKAMSEAAIRRARRPGEFERRSKVMSNNWKSSKFRVRHAIWSSRTAKHLWKTKKFRTKMMRVVREHGDWLSGEMLKKWKDPEYRKLAFSRFSRTSKPQRILYDKLQKFSEESLETGLFMEEPILEYPVDSEGRTFSIDIAFPESKVGIEVDGKYWHNLSGRKESDNERDFILWNSGWKILRVDAAKVKNRKTVSRVLNFLSGWLVCDV